MSDEKLDLRWRDPPPADLSKEVYDALFPPRPERPKPRTLYDDLPEGLTDANPVAPQLKKPDPLVLHKERQPDELVPFASRLWPVGLNDLPQMGWLVERLMVRCPHVEAHTWQRTLVTYIGSNFCFFRRSERACGLAVLTVGSFSAPFVEGLFLLHCDIGPEGGTIKGSVGEKDAIALGRAMKDWGRRMGCVEIRRLNDISDIPPSQLVHELRGEKHEDVRIPIR